MSIKKVLKDTLPVLSGYLVLGMGFGLLMHENGYGILWTLAMSIFIYAGAMQYTAVGLLADSELLVAVALTTLMVNARHIFYGISMIDKYKGMGKIKPYLIFALTDETYSLVCSGHDDESFEDRKKYYFAVSLVNHIYWVVGSAIGALVGEFINLPTEGIEFALTALFVTVFVEQWKSTKDHIPAIIGVLSSVVSLLIFGTSKFLIAAMLLITLLLFVLKLVRREGKKI